MRSTISIRSVLATVGLALVWLLFLVVPAAADPDDEGGAGCPPGGCVNVYGDPDPAPDPPSHGGGDSGCCGGGTSTDPGHGPDPVEEPGPIVVVPAQPVPAQPVQPRSQPRPAAGFVPADAPIVPQGVLDLTATSRGAGEVLTGQISPAASSNGLPGNIPPWVPIGGGLLIAAGAAAALGSAPRTPAPVGAAGPPGSR